MKNLVNGSLFLSDDPKQVKSEYQTYKKYQRLLWYKVKRNKIAAGAILISFFLSLTLLFVAIYFATSLGEQLNIKTGPVEHSVYYVCKILLNSCRLLSMSSQ